MRKFLFRYNDDHGNILEVTISPVKTLKEAENYFKDFIGNYRIIYTKELSN